LQKKAQQLSHTTEQKLVPNFFLWNKTFFFLRILDTLTSSIKSVIGNISLGTQELEVTFNPRIFGLCISKDNEEQLKILENFFLDGTLARKIKEKVEFLKRVKELPNENFTPTTLVEKDKNILLKIW